MFLDNWFIVIKRYQKFGSFVPSNNTSIVGWYYIKLFFGGGVSVMITSDKFTCAFISKSHVSIKTLNVQ